MEACDYWRNNTKTNFYEWNIWLKDKKENKESGWFLFLTDKWYNTYPKLSSLQKDKTYLHANFALRFINWGISSTVISRSSEFYQNKSRTFRWIHKSLHEIHSQIINPRFQGILDSTKKKRKNNIQISRKELTLKCFLYFLLWIRFQLLILFPKKIEMVENL